jgi:hypothetical protein
VYLVNEPIHKLLGGPVARLAGQNGVVFSVLWIPLAIGIPLAVSAALHAWLEKPALRWGRAIAAGFAVRR